MPYTLATLKCSHALTSWTCEDFFLMNLTYTIIQFLKSAQVQLVKAWEHFKVGRGYGTIRGFLAYLYITLYTILNIKKIILNIKYLSDLWDKMNDLTRNNLPLLCNQFTKSECFFACNFFLNNDLTKYWSNLLSWSL